MNEAKTPEEINGLSNLEENDLILERYEKLKKRRQVTDVCFPNKFRRTDLAEDLAIKYADSEREDLAVQLVKTSVCGRIMLRRIMGKASFVTIQDASGRLQIYLKEKNLSTDVYRDFLTWDLGDIIGCEGLIFRTKSGELSVLVNDIILLTKSLRPLPEKHRGLVDTEARYRQRYLDLIMNSETRKTFRLRSKIISTIRSFFEERDFQEVETPMLQVIPGGASARPFVTNHNSLDMQMYLRVAPELYLKRLIVGGLEKVFEINRNFRNEGISTRHNPEFTMLEFYWAYADYKDLMKLTESLFKDIAIKCFKNTDFKISGDRVVDIDKSFEVISLKKSIEKMCPRAKGQLDNIESANDLADSLGIDLSNKSCLGHIQLQFFESIVEPFLLDPTFIIEYPAVVSPLARRNDTDPFLADRFEFFIGGREIANGFSELNDAEDQSNRFKNQALAKASGDDEAMFFDAEYIKALEYGLPPTAGQGIGIDRLVMFFTETASIRDVILFPTMKKKEN